MGLVCHYACPSVGLGLTIFLAECLAGFRNAYCVYRDVISLLPWGTGNSPYWSLAGRERKKCGTEDHSFCPALCRREPCP